MEKCFLNKRYLFCFLLTVFCLCVCTALVSQIDSGVENNTSISVESDEIAINEGSLKDLPSIEESELLFAEFYKTGKIDTEPLFVGLEKLEQELTKVQNLKGKERNIEKENQLLTLYLEYAKIVFTAYLFGSINQSFPKIHNMEKQIDVFLKRCKPNSSVCLKFADYLYARLPENRKVVFKLPVLYRKVLLQDSKNNEAKVKLACWYTFSAQETTSNTNSFIEENEALIEELSAVDRLNAYIVYSLYYMKKYNTKKGWKYLQKAEELFPSYILTERLRANYKKGILSL
ncbi:hypothetical protein DWQ65_01600 [Treponema phagedenis]|uniref:Lipoprotein n=1 Tax=Treponema phagedenis TaxID=162 RepID=A0A0B7GZK1_TREPH|nr:hypothetical protein [Treponema phagedenis]QSH95806.1 hypothetical protein C5O78_12445 [Treponema phagedenis]QSH98788.1 hypothetical protein DWQ65_01600 [Treponema phagedenis]CEM63067.1 conserved exported hypothetical protein [Treponema phagedenis]